MFFFGRKLSNIGVANPKHLKVLKSSKSLELDLLFKLKSTPGRTSQKNKSTSPKTTLIFINLQSIEPLQVFKHPTKKTSPIANPRKSSRRRTNARQSESYLPQRKTCPDGTESATKLLLLCCRRGQQNSATEQNLPNLPGTPSTLVAFANFPRQVDQPASPGSASEVLFWNRPAGRMMLSLTRRVQLRRVERETGSRSDLRVF